MSVILFLLDYYSPHKWWIENVFEHLINWLLEKWYKITLITSRFQDDLKEYEKVWNLTIYRVWKWRKWFFFKWFVKACKVLRKNKNIKIIHITNIIFLILSFIVSSDTVQFIINNNTKKNHIIIALFLILSFSKIKYHINYKNYPNIFKLI